MIENKVEKKLYAKLEYGAQKQVGQQVWDGTYLRAAQTATVDKVFKKVINDFSTIIEVGFFRGAFSEWLYQNKNPNTQLACYDITFNHKINENPEIDFRQGDCFSEETSEDIKKLTQQKGSTLLLCDGGSKNKEFIKFSKFLKTGDVIMLHDYAHTPQDFSKWKSTNEWPHASESSFQAIEGAVKENDLSPYHYDDFKSVFWGAFIK